MEGNVADDDGSATDSTKIKRPILGLISPVLARAWRVNQEQKMCFIFDLRSPARRFKRGMVYNEDANFPQDSCDGDITETDGPGLGWMPVDPVMAVCVSKHSTPHRRTNGT